MVADTMIKPLPRGMHRKFCGSMGLGKVRAGKSKMSRVEEVDKDSKGHGSGGLGVWAACWGTLDRVVVGHGAWSRE